MAGPRRPLALFLAGTALAAQAPVGKLLYSNSVGRGVILSLQDGGDAGHMRIRPETGDAERMRLFVLQRSGLEARVAVGAGPAPGRIPAGWKAGTNGQGTLLRAGNLFWWRYAPGLVVPSRFVFDKQEWNLLSADLPPRAIAN